MNSKANGTDRRRAAELLAPAGSFESMKAAVAAGADAVYIGGSRFGARAYADNLDEEQMLEAIDYAHLHGVSLYMTVNTLVKEKELDGLYDYLAPYYERGLDAVIVQDLGVLSAVRQWFPDMSVHASTQMTVTGVSGARLLKEMGVSRVVTARELSLAELRAIHENVDIEIESFIHGALCYCYSGQCLLSSLIGGRSGNRGRCAQPCRLPYDVKGVLGSGEEIDAGRGLQQRRKKTSGQKLAVAGKAPSEERYLNGRDEKYVMSLRDLCTLDILPDILESGVYSLKIEGRMKSPRYTAGVVSIYRKYVDLYLKEGRGGYRVDDRDRQMLLELFDRGGHTEGYYRKHNGKDMLALKEKPEFRQTDKELFDYLDRTYVEAETREKISGRLTALEGEPLRFTLWPALGSEAKFRENPLTEVAGAVVQTAQNQPVTAERLERQMRKTGGTPFEFDELEICAGGNIFVPVQALNELRRQGLEAFRQELLKPYRRPAGKPDIPVSRPDARGEGESAFAGVRGEEESTLTGVRGDREFTFAGVRGEGGSAPAAARGDSGSASAAARGDGESAPVAACGNGEPAPAGAAGQEEWIPRVHVLVSDGRQFDAAVKEADVSEIQIEADAMPQAEWQSAVRRCHEEGKKCVLAMPVICRTAAQDFFRLCRKELCGAGFDGFLIRSLEEPDLLKKLYGESGGGEMPPLYADHNLYVFNHRSAETLIGMGYERLTCPLELNARELQELAEELRDRTADLADAGNGEGSQVYREGRLFGRQSNSPNLELPAYGYLPVMTTAQCIRRTVSGCDRKSGFLALKDRTGKDLPVYNHCAFCYNTIYNPTPLALPGMESTLRRLRPAALRLQFLNETPQEISDIVRVYGDAFLRRKEPLHIQGGREYTRGHMKRGVE